MKALASSLFATFLAASCISPPENERLGIVRFELRETASFSSVIAWDAEGTEVGRLELVQGAFTLSGEFADGHDDPRVVGRKLSVQVLGQGMRWETEGFEPTLHMPAHPRSQWAIAAFLRDPHVQPILDRAGIGFETSSAVRNVDRFDWHLNGSTPLDCSGKEKCPMVFPTVRVPNTCAGAVPPEDVKEIVAWRVHQRRPDAEYDGYDYWRPELSRGVFDQAFIVQCCPAGFFGEKACPDFEGMVEGVSYPITCGAPTVPGNCRACASYDTNDKCDILLLDSGDNDPLAPGDDKTVYDVYGRYNWACRDGSCKDDAAP